MDEEIYLTDLITPLLARWKVILLFAIIGALTGFTVARLGPRYYESTATIYVQPAPAAGLLGNLPIPIANNNSSTGYLTTLLQSETLLRSVIARLQLKENRTFTEGKTLNTEAAVRLLRGRTSVKDSKSGSITIAVRARSPRLAADIGNVILDGLGTFVVTSSRRKADFISAKLDETTRELQDAEDDMLAFQQRNDITAIDEETKELIRQLSQMDGQVLALEVELQELGSELEHAGDLNTLVDQEVRRKSVESSKAYVVERRAELHARLGRLPSVAAQYMRLQRRIVVLSKTFELLTEQYQLARIKQQGEDGDYQVIDRARPKMMPLPRGTMMKAGLGGMLGITLASMLVSARALARKRKKSGRAASATL